MKENPEDDIVWLLFTLIGSALLISFIINVGT
jgi:hypothetical protein